LVLAIEACFDLPTRLFFNAKQLICEETEKSKGIPMNKDMLDLFPIGKSSNFRITRERCISIPSEVMVKLGWHYEDEVATSIIVRPLILLLWRAPSDRAGYTLHTNGVKPQNGIGSGKLSMSSFINTYLEGKLYKIESDAPIDIVPTYIDFAPYQVALTFQEPPWAETIPFLPLHIKDIEPELGIYFLLNRRGVPLKIGKGNLISRLSSHYKEPEKQALVTHVRYFPANIELLRVLEKIMIAKHVAKYGSLPLFNKINA
jgi:hypothetical protein